MACRFEVTVPNNQLLAGQNYVLHTYDMTCVTDDAIVAGPAIIEILPAYDN